MARGLACVSVLDISATALARARERLRSAAGCVRWIDSDVTDPAWHVDPVDLWHDRAVLHFLVHETDRRQYVDRLHRTVKVGGAVVIGTFALDGPSKCSGLPVMRYDPETLTDTLGIAFRLDEALAETHQTPFGTTQAFQWCRFRRVQ